MKKQLYENYRSRRDLQLSSFEFFSSEVVKMLKKINNIFGLKGIFVFSHLQFDGVRAQTDDSGMEGTKKLEQWRCRPLNFSRGTQDITIFFNGTQKISSFLRFGSMTLPG